MIIIPLSAGFLCALPGGMTPKAKREASHLNGQSESGRQVWSSAKRQMGRPTPLLTWLSN